MILILGILAAAALAGIFFLFLSPKSSRIQKKAALGALIVSGCALLVCAVVIILNLAGKDKDPYAFPVPADDIVPAARSNFFELILFLVLLLSIFAIIIFLGIRERNRQSSAKTREDIRKNRKSSGR